MTGSVKYIGHQILKTNVDVSALPMAETTALWQAWEMPSGVFMLQGLSTERHPTGPLVPLEKDLFDSLFTGVAGLANQTSNAHAPDLILQWYMQTLTASGLPLPSVAGKPDQFLAQPFSAAEKAFMLAERKEAATSPAHQFRLSITQPSMPLDDLPPSPGAALLMPDEAADSDTGEAVSIGTATVAPPAPANGAEMDTTHFARLEENLLQQFETIQHDLKTKNQIDLVSQLMRLLKSPSFNYPEMHFLFTEFGLALRRDKQYELALLCHMRANDVAPDDERVLFNIARTEYELGNVDKSREYLQRALDLAPRFAVARHFLSFLDGEGM